MQLVPQISPGDFPALWLCAAAHANIYMHISLDSNSRRGKTVGVEDKHPRSILAKKKKKKKKKTEKKTLKRVTPEFRVNNKKKERNVVTIWHLTACEMSALFLTLSCENIVVL